MTKKVIAKVSVVARGYKSEYQLHIFAISETSNGVLVMFIHVIHTCQALKVGQNVILSP